jgi:tRNA pseudouridine38-40 synthase
MPRYKLTIEYDGTPFAGWQEQAEHASVQGEAVKRFSGEAVTVKGAGRTDAGVHARGQVAHLDLGRDWEPFRIREAVNFHLKPAPVAVLECDRVAAVFDARFSATARHYLYRILCRRAPPVLERNRVWWLAGDLDAAAMSDAAGVLVGRHDFSTFRAAACQAKSPVKTLDRLEIVRDGTEIRIEASARSFLHSQVRTMVGSLKLVGEDKWRIGDVERALAAKDRSLCGPVAPAAGLYLMRVDYGSDVSASGPRLVDDEDDE